MRGVAPALGVLLSALTAAVACPAQVLVVTQQGVVHSFSVHGHSAPDVSPLWTRRVPYPLLEAAASSEGAMASVELDCMRGGIVAERRSKRGEDGYLACPASLAGGGVISLDFVARVVHDWTVAPLNRTRFAVVASVAAVRPTCEPADLARHLAGHVSPQLLANDAVAPMGGMEPEFGPTVRATARYRRVSFAPGGPSFPLRGKAHAAFFVAGAMEEIDAAHDAHPIPAVVPAEPFSLRSSRTRRGHLVANRELRLTVPAAHPRAAPLVPPPLLRRLARHINSLHDVPTLSEVEEQRYFLALASATTLEAARILPRSLAAAVLDVGHGVRRESAPAVRRALRHCATHLVRTLDLPSMDEREEMAIVHTLLAVLSKAMVRGRSLDNVLPADLEAATAAAADVAARDAAQRERSVLGAFVFRTAAAVVAALGAAGVVTARFLRHRSLCPRRATHGGERYVQVGRSRLLVHEAALEQPPAGRSLLPGLLDGVPVAVRRGPIDRRTWRALHNAASTGRCRCTEPCGAHSVVCV